MSNLTAEDMDNLKGLKLALKQNPSFGVGTDPKRDENSNLA